MKKRISLLKRIRLYCSNRIIYIHVNTYTYVSVLYVYIIYIYCYVRYLVAIISFAYYIIIITITLAQHSYNTRYYTGRTYIYIYRGGCALYNNIYVYIVCTDGRE
jgi:hypothetical protein